MGHAKRKEEGVHANYRRRVETEDSARDDSVTERTLSLRLGTEDGDPVAGIRNALIASTVFWVALALAFAYVL